MKYFKLRKARKELKEVLHHARHIRHMHEDIGDPELLAKLKQAEGQGKAARKGDSIQKMEGAGNVVCDLAEKARIPRPHRKIRENVEVLFVAIAAAMAIRAYIFQPFKIPTGSMQPTLYGITVRNLEQGEARHLPTRIAKFFWKGEVFLGHNSIFDRMAKFIAVGKGYSANAKNDGVINMRIQRDTHGNLMLDPRDNFGPNHVTIYVGGVSHVVPKASLNHIRNREYVHKGESLLRGIAKAGDYILVNRMKYNFFPPKRGDIVVFDAKDVARDAYYIKRMVGLPGETISVDPPYLKVNGEKPTDSRFDKLFSNGEYSGYVFGGRRSGSIPLIENLGDSIQLADDEYLFFGDNTVNSLDGRYFGGVKRERLLGSAFFVGLPFDRAGRVETIH